MAARVLRHLEPHIEDWVDRFLRSDDGQRLLADTVADVFADLVHPSDGQDLAERIVLRLAAKLAATRPDFRRRLLDTLSSP
jgi:hypothetical protein